MKRRMRVRISHSAYWLCFAASAATLSPLGVRGYGVVPEPQRVELSGAAARVYRVFYGDGVERMDYQLMSEQAHFWLDSRAWGPSARKPIWGYSGDIYNPRQPVKDQTLALPEPGRAGAAEWLKANERRLNLAADFLAGHGELLGLLEENVRRVSWNRYNLEVYVPIARMLRQNMEMLTDLGRMSSVLSDANNNVEPFDRALELAGQIRQQRNVAYRDLAAVYERAWFPRILKATRRAFIHELDDAKDHVADRTVDRTYMIERELQLPFGDWVESIRAERNRVAAAKGLAQDTRALDWLDMSDHPVVGGIPGE